MNDLYEVLGVPKTATKDEITKAYRKGAKAHHPDVNPGDPDAARRFRELQEAYDILNDPVKRGQYDRGGRTMHFQSRGMGNPFEDIVNEMFRQSAFQGRNVQVKLDLSFEDAFIGCKKEITLRVRNRCNTCNGQGQTSTEICKLCNGNGFVNVPDAPFDIRTSCSGCNATGRSNLQSCGDCNGTGNSPGYKEKSITVVVPAGVDNGAVIRIKGEGEDSLRPAGRAGDVLVHLVVGDHHIYRRQGIDLMVDVPVCYTDLALGREMEIPYLNGEKIVVKIPPGTQSHSKFKLNGKGGALPNGLIGDLIVTFKLETVKNPAGRYKELLDELAKFEAENLDVRRQAWQKKTSSPNT
jgi:molecular chaperone DnaJ